MNRFWCSIFIAFFVFCSQANLLVGCARLPMPTRSAYIGETGLLGECAQFFDSLDKQTQKSGVLDSGEFRVKNYPYLRVNRFLASFNEEVVDADTFAAWVNRMQVIDQDARQFEIANLPSSVVADFNAGTDRAELYQKVVLCGDMLKAADFQTVRHQEGLSKNAAVPDEYITPRRVLGIYPLTSMFIYRGVSIWHKEARKSYSAKPPENWQSTRYHPSRNIDNPAALQTQTIQSVKYDALGIPVYSAEARQALFRLYAPVWEVQLESEDDRVGAPMWTAKGDLAVDTTQPLTYTLLSFTRFGQEILTQLNYIIWFPARPKKSALDIYGGFLDGVNYRVTLDIDYEPLLYETVHNCGCYYKAYPTNRLRVREKIDYAEPPLILPAPVVNHSKEFLIIAMERQTHYVQHLYASSRESQSMPAMYSTVDYAQLRSLPYSNGDRKSMFSPNSIAPGSERSERFILWPTGVLSPGAMRQWGRHAVAFMGRRHFDDPFFMDNIFLKNDR